MAYLAITVRAQYDQGYCASRATAPNHSHAAGLHNGYHRPSTTHMLLACTMAITIPHTTHVLLACMMAASSMPSACSSAPGAPTARAAVATHSGAGRWSTEPNSSRQAVTSGTGRRSGNACVAASTAPHVLFIGAASGSLGAGGAVESVPRLPTRLMMAGSEVGEGVEANTRRRWSTDASSCSAQGPPSRSTSSGPRRTLRHTLSV